MQWLQADHGKAARIFAEAADFFVLKCFRACQGLGLDRRHPIQQALILLSFFGDKGLSSCDFFRLKHLHQINSGLGLSSGVNWQASNSGFIVNSSKNGTYQVRSDHDAPNISTFR